ncbi:MAG: DJ-1/PfpI family protein [Candidatus ainarchaeum sp.]|nr:DJ-1/PfpI family protein [Candidatus ainarchaeum sp.]
MAKIVLVIAQKNFRDEELFFTKEELEKAGHETVIAGKQKGTAIGMLGGKAEISLELKQVKTGDFDAIIFVGGSGSETYFKDAAALKLAKEFSKEGKIVAAICIAPMILANAGLLKGKKATCTGLAEKIEAKGAKLTEALVETDGKIITGKGPQAAREFGKKISEML